MKTVDRKLVWEQSDKDCLIENYHKMKLSELAKMLGISITSMVRKATELGLTRSSMTTKKFWKEEEIQYLKDNYPTMPLDDLREVLPYSVPTIARKARELGLKKDESYSRGSYTGRYVNRYKLKI